MKKDCNCFLKKVLQCFHRNNLLVIFIYCANVNLKIFLALKCGPMSSPWL